MKRTWYRNTHRGGYFRNCGLVRADQGRLVNRLLPWRWRPLAEEWLEVFHQGIVKCDQPPAGDRVVPYDDSPEATERWARRFLDSHGKDVTG